MTKQHSPSTRQQQYLPLFVATLIYTLPTAITCFLYFVSTENSPHFLPALPRSDAYFYTYNAWFRAFVDPTGGVTQDLIPVSLYVDYLVNFLKIFGFSAKSIYTANTLLLVASACILCITARTMYGSRTAVWCSLIVALCGPILFFNGTAMKTIFVVFLFSLFISFASQYLLKKHPLWLVPSCLVVFLSTVDRHNAIALLIPIVFLSTYYSIQRGKIHLFTMLGAIAVSFSLMTSIVDWKQGEVEPEFNAPLGLNFYVGNNERSTGGYTRVYGLSNDLYGHRKQIGPFTEAKVGAQLTKEEISTYWFQQSLGFIQSSPSSYAKLQLKKLILLGSQYTYGSPEQFAAWRWVNPVLSVALVDYSVLIALCIVACVIGAPKRAPEAGFLLGCFAVYAASIWVFFVTERYRIPLYTFLIPLAAYGFESFLKSTIARKIACLSIFAPAVALSIAGNKTMDHGYGWPANHKEYRNELEQAARNMAPLYQGMTDLSRTPSAEAYMSVAGRLRTPFYMPDAAQVLLQAIQRYPTNPELLEQAFKVAISLNQDGLLQEVEKKLSGIESMSRDQRKLLQAVRTYYKRRKAIQSP